MTTTIGQRVRERIEDIRFGGERTIALRVPEARQRYGLSTADNPHQLWTVRRSLMAEGIRLDSGVDPALHALIEQARRTLGVTVPVEAYQLANPDPRGMNGAMVRFRDVAILIFFGRLLTLLDSPGQLEVIGHELGHHIAHNQRPTWTVRPSTGALSFSPRLQAAFSMSCELTADRFGMLACQDLDALLRFQMVETTGLSVSELRWSPAAYLDQSRQLMDELRSRHQSIEGTTHPEHNLRAYASWLFSESDLYRDLTGKGPGTRSLRAIDRELAELLALPPVLLDELTARPPAARPAPSVTRPAPTRPAPHVAQPTPPPARPAPRPAPSVLVRPPEPPRAPIPEVRQTGSAWVDRGREAITQAIRGRPSAAPSTTPDHDPLADDERDLIARFEELERKLNSR